MDSVEGCIFCTILHKNQEVIYQDELVYAFHDISKDDAREHILVCPKEHIKNINSLNSSHISLVERMKEVGEKILNEIDPTAEKRYGFHVPPFYSVKHLHMHVVMGPITSFYRRNMTFGFMLRRWDTLIDKLKSKSKL